MAMKVHGETSGGYRYTFIILIVVMVSPVYTQISTVTKLYTSNMCSVLYLCQENGKGKKVKLKTILKNK